MKARFSDRIGKTQPKTELLKDGISQEVINALWTVILDTIIKRKRNELFSGEAYTPNTIFFRSIWIHFFKYPSDYLRVEYGKVNAVEATETLREWFFHKSQWFEKMNLVEFIGQDEGAEFQEICNSFLKIEFSAYRFIDGILT